MITATYTRSDAMEDISNAIGNLFGSNFLDREAVTRVFNAMSKDIQVRDYFMGQPMVFGLEECISFLQTAGEYVDEEDKHHALTILAMWMYEAGDTEMANALLVLSEQVNKDYQLTSLLKRVFSAGWPAGEVKSMREHLHPQVATIMQESAESPVGEEGDARF